MEYVEILVKRKYIQIDDEMLTIRSMLFDVIHLKYYWTKTTINDKWINIPKIKSQNILRQFPPGDHFPN